MSDTMAVACDGHSRQSPDKLKNPFAHVAHSGPADPSAQVASTPPRHAEARGHAYTGGMMVVSIEDNERLKS